MPLKVFPRAALLTCLILLLSGCSERRDTWRLKSPSGQQTAYVVLQLGGGATVGSIFEVIVTGPGEQFTLRGKTPLVWKSYEVPVKYVFWRDESTIEILVSSLDRKHFDTIGAARGGRLRIVTTVLNGTSKENVLQSSTELDVHALAPQ